MVINGVNDDTLSRRDAIVSGGSTGTFLASGGNVGPASFTADGKTVVFTDAGGGGGSWNH